MEDCDNCPVCQNKLKILRNVYQPSLDISSIYTLKLCHGLNHKFEIYVLNNKIHLLKFSNDPFFSKIIDVDYYNKKTNIHHGTYLQLKKITLPKTIEVDFNNLNDFNKLVNKYITFS